MEKKNKTKRNSNGVRGESGRGEAARRASLSPLRRPAAQCPPHREEGACALALLGAPA